MILACYRLLRKISIACSYSTSPEFHGIPWKFLCSQAFILYECLVTKTYIPIRIVYLIGKLSNGHGGWTRNVIGYSEKSLTDSIASSFKTKSFSGLLKPLKNNYEFHWFFLEFSYALKRSNELGDANDCKTIQRKTSLFMIITPTLSRIFYDIFFIEFAEIWKAVGARETLDGLRHAFPFQKKILRNKKISESPLPSTLIRNF